MDGEDGVWAGGVFVHQCVAHRPVPPALLYDPLTLSHAVHSVHGEVPHIHTPLGMIFQLSIHQPHKKKKKKNTASSKLLPCSNTLTFKESCHHGNLHSIVQKSKHCIHRQNRVRNRFHNDCTWIRTITLLVSHVTQICLLERQLTSNLCFVSLVVLFNI